MGGGSYNYKYRVNRAQASGYYAKEVKQVTSSSLKSELDPRRIDVRECCDNLDHPNTIPFILALDVTASMGDIPQNLIRDGLPTIMAKLHEAGLSDIALCFMAFGDAHDNCPLQVGQFEASDEALDKWLTSIYLEGHGCGNNGEDPISVYHFASNYVKSDAWTKRNQKGIIITITDERCHNNYDGRNQLGDKEPENGLSRDQALTSAREKWFVYNIATHVTLNDTQNGIGIIEDWNEFLGGDYNIYEKDVDKIPQTIVDIIISRYGKKDEAIEAWSTHSKITEIKKPHVTL